MHPRASGLLLFILVLLSLIVSGCTAPQVKTAGPAATPTPTLLPAAPGEMKTIGIIGGVGWSSSLVYYRIMNERVQETLGGDNSAKIVMYSIEFGEFSKQERLATAGNWTPLNATLIDAARRLKYGGADFIVIGSNTLNSRAGLIEQETGLPVLRIYDVTAGKVNRSGIKKVALLGTKFTMEEPYYNDALAKYGITVVTPNATERDYINTVIFDQLVRNDIRNDARKEYVRIINRLIDEEGARGVILGCTEIPLLIEQKDVNVPVFDTTRIHAEAAVDYALGRA
nr:aspartate/glutamate racemase family protein [uncultured Methanoregula sp.]